MSHTDLRELIRDPQYWRRSPEGDALRAKVARGFAERYPGPMRRDATGRQSDSGADGHVVQVRSYSRREQDGGTHTVRAHDRRAVARAWERQPNADWRVEIAREESSGGSRPDHGYGLTRGSGDTRALGRYQLQPTALRDAEWMDKQGNWTRLANAAGVRTDADFLSNPDIQERALNEVMRKFRERLERNGWLQSVGTSVVGVNGQSIPVTESGLMAAAHRQGPTALARYFRHRQAGLPKPANIPGSRTDLSVFNATLDRLTRFSQIALPAPGFR